jgi:hypothetical protein
VREHALRDGKLVYMAVPRLAEDPPFYELDPGRLPVPPGEAASREGAVKVARRVGPGQMRPVEMVVCGSVAVNRDGTRLGKGAGSAPSSAAAARSRSGSGLACRTWSRVIIGVSSGSPSSASVGRAVAAYPLVAIAHRTPGLVSAASSSRQRRDRIRLGTVLVRVRLLEQVDIGLGQRPPSFPQQRLHEQPARSSRCAGGSATPTGRSRFASARPARR